jgi:hypothetical protein
MRRVVMLATVISLSSPAYAAGTVNGTITGTDDRINPYEFFMTQCGPAPNGARQTFANGTFDVREILVQLQVIDEATSTIYETVWTRTNDANGTYSMPFTTPVGGVSLRVRVYPERPLLAQGAVASTRPPVEFRVGATPPALIQALGGPPANNGGTRTINLPLPASEHLNAYRTLLEVYTLYNNQGGIRQSTSSLWTGMAGVTVHVNSAPTLKITPTAYDIFIESDTATRDVYTIAHEMGHILNWRGLAMTNAPIFPTDYEMNVNGCGGLSWSRGDCEFEKIAFAEGFADAHGALYLWTRAAPPTTCSGLGIKIPRDTPQGVAMESAGTCAPPNDFFDKNRPICTARALWDIIDDPPGDDDPMSAFDLTQLKDILTVYPRNCVCNFFDNRCAREGDAYWCPPHNDLDGANWKDFRANWEANSGNPADLNAVEDANGLDAQDNN